MDLKAGGYCLEGRGTLNWVGHVERMEETKTQEQRNAKRAAEGKTRLGIYMSRGDNNIKMVRKSG
jgi:hypothetical protein